MIHFLQLQFYWFRGPLFAAVRLRDRDAGWKRRLFETPCQTDFKQRLNTLNESTLTKSGRLFKIVGAASRKARDAVTVFKRYGTISKSELDERSVLAGLYEINESSK